MANDDYITLTEARSLTLGALRASEQSFTLGTDNDIVDRAILTATDEVVRRVPDITLTTGTVATNATATGIDVTTMDGAWRPQRNVRFEFGHHIVDHVDYPTVADAIAEGSVGTQRPDKVAFRIPSDGFFNYCPGTANPVLTVTWRQPFTDIDPGVTPGTTSLNMPAQYMRPILMLGAAVFLEYYDVEGRIPSGAFERFERFISSLRGDIGMETDHLPDPNDYV